MSRTQPSIKSAFSFHQERRPHLLDQVWIADLEDAAGDGLERHLKPEFGAFPALFLGALKAPERFRLSGGESNTAVGAEHL